MRVLEALLHQRVRCFSRCCQSLKPVYFPGFWFPFKTSPSALAGGPVAEPIDPATHPMEPGASTKHTAGERLSEIGSCRCRSVGLSSWGL